ncbi:hypothetical protein [Marinimicrobium agarilyticum]|uniref:hypothetical protein n=1 Tax=Marinimicrobium agarilyticum TaxID=306546 RepID=UPI0012F65D0A|nr:hypothetical protein [Marinimicrobium agarilyticum]
MLQASRMHFENLFSENRSKPLEPHESTLAALHANAFYVGIRGALDNLAWAAQFQFSLFSGVTEGGKGRGKIDLFKDCFVEAVEERFRVLGEKLRAKQEWSQDFKKFRDPAAHRIPIYVPPGVVRKQELEEYMDELSRESMSALGTSPQVNCDGVETLAHPVPVMILGGDSLSAYPLFYQIKKDYRRFLSISRSVICEIKSNC